MSLNRVRVSTPGPHLPTQASVEYPLPRAPDRSTFRMDKSVHSVEGHDLSDESQVFCLSDNLLRMISPSRYYINSVNLKTVRIVTNFLSIRSLNTIYDFHSCVNISIPIIYGSIVNPQKVNGSQLAL